MAHGLATLGDETAHGVDPRAVRVDAGEAVFGHVRRALAGLRFGEVTVTLQDGVIVQIDRKEKTRLN